MVRACTECGSENFVKNGKRSTENGSKKQLYYCNSCGTNFTEPGFKQKSYPGKVIITALKLYSTGYTLKETSKQVNKRFKVNASRNTVYNWVKEYRNVCKLLQNREKYTEDYNSGQIIDENLYVHQGLEYPYLIHRRKLELAENHGFEKLTGFLKDLDKEIDHSLFEDSLRSSQTESGGDCGFKHYINNACKLAELALQANHNRKKRHEAVQDLMLKTDKATIATEVPVWYYNKKLESTVTGHIDILQTRNNKIHILDYKPKAEKVEPVSQLRNYVKALSYRTGMPKEKFKAAWFNENVYRELCF